MLKSPLVAEKDPFIQNYDCLCSGDARQQGISSHGFHHALNHYIWVDQTMRNNRKF